MKEEEKEKRVSGIMEEEEEEKEKIETNKKRDKWNNGCTWDSRHLSTLVGWEVHGRVSLRGGHFFSCLLSSDTGTG